MPRPPDTGDERVTVSQTCKLYHALKDNDIEIRFIAYPVGGHSPNDPFHVLADNAVYFVRTIDFDPADENSSTFKREVVTKVWSKTDEGWKIVHFHSSVHSVSGM